MRIAGVESARRATEVCVAEGERLATVAWLHGLPYPAESLDKARRQLACEAHPDGGTGTAVTGPESGPDLLAALREAWQRGDAVRREAIEFLAASCADSGARGLAVIVVNGIGRVRDGMATATVRLESPGVDWLEVLDPQTRAVLPTLAEGVRRHQDGTLAEVTVTFLAAAMPALGLRRYPLRAVAAAAADSGSAATAGWADADGTTISNDAFEVTADPSRGGALSAVLDKRARRQVLRGLGNELVLRGPDTDSAPPAATVRAQRSPAGSRLVAQYRLGDLMIVAETLLWDGADWIEFRTHVSGPIGEDHPLRVRFPASLPGGLPVYQTATAVTGQPFGTPEADVAGHGRTPGNRARHWFGVGSVLRLALATPDGAVPVALGVAEVVTPDALPGQHQSLVRDLVNWLASAGVTATTRLASAPRGGPAEAGPTPPDFRIALGGPSQNAFTAEVLAACDPSVASRLTALLADGAAARLWVPASAPRAAALGPGADLRGARALPVLIIAPAETADPADPPDLKTALTELRSEVWHKTVVADGADVTKEAVGAARVLAPGDAPLADGTVALFNRGTPECAVTPDGTLWMSLLPACQGRPDGVPADSGSYTFWYALAATDAPGGWRSAGFNAAAEEYNHDLVTLVSGDAAAAAPQAPAGPAAGVSYMSVSGGGQADGTGRIAVFSAPNVTLTALKPFGNRLAPGAAAAPSAESLVSVRLRETDGRPAIARLRLDGGIAAAWRADIGEQSLGMPLTVHDGVAFAGLMPFETVTVAVRPSRPVRLPRP